MNVVVGLEVGLFSLSFLLSPRRALPHLQALQDLFKCYCANSGFQGKVAFLTNIPEELGTSICGQLLFTPTK